MVSSELRNQNCFRSCRKLCTTHGAKDEELNRLQHECKISAAKLKMMEQMKGEVARVDHAVRLYAYAIPKPCT